MSQLGLTPKSLCAYSLWGSLSLRSLRSSDRLDLSPSFRTSIEVLYMHRCLSLCSFDDWSDFGFCFSAFSSSNNNVLTCPSLWNRQSPAVRSTILIVSLSSSDSCLKPAFSLGVFRTRRVLYGSCWGRGGRINDQIQYNAIQLNNSKATKWM